MIIPLVTVTVFPFAVVNVPDAPFATVTSAAAGNSLIRITCHFLSNSLTRFSSDSIFAHRKPM